MRLIRYLYVTNFITGAAVMILELLGTRFLAPYFGASLYTWTALITVTLVALALGYRAGGYLADRFPHARALYGLILSAAAFLVLILLIRSWVLKVSSGFGIVGGTLFAAAVLFGPPLLILGTVAPFSVKLCASELAGLGSVVGRLYAISTLGSFVGTVSAGFLLVPNFGTVGILVFCAAALGVTSALFFLFFERKASPSCGALLLVLLAALTAYRAGRLPSGKIPRYDLEWKAIYQTNSFYGRIRILDIRRFSEKTWSSRYLLNDGLIQGVYDLEAKEPNAVFPYALTDLVLSTVKRPKKALVLGLGAGFVPRLLYRTMDRGGTADKVVTVEINPRMHEVAVRFFDFPSGPEWEKRCPVFIEDARTWVQHSKEKFDVIVVDTFLGDNAPTHLLSSEMFRSLRKLLNPQGAMAINIFGSILGSSSRLVAALVKTLKCAPDGGPGPFPHVQVFSEEATAKAHNIFVLAGPKDTPVRADGVLSLVPPRHLYDRVSKALHDQTAELRGVDKTTVLSDDYNPAELLDVGVRVGIREDIRTFWGDALAD